MRTSVRKKEKKENKPIRDPIGFPCQCMHTLDMPEDNYRKERKRKKRSQ